MRLLDDIVQKNGVQEGTEIMPQWNHPPQPRGATTREQTVIDSLQHLADESSDLDACFRPIVADGLKLILKLIEGRGKQADFLELYDRPHED